MKYYLTAMAMFKNDAIYLKEWLDFHLLIGFQHFYMYDNMSTDNPIEVLQPYIDSGVVTYTEWDKDLANHPQCNPHRMHHIEKYGSLSRWIGFFDIDEFIYPELEDETLCDILTDFEEFPGVQIHFLVFGSNGHEKYEPGLVIDRFTKRGKSLGANGFKSIIDPSKALESTTAHYFKYKDNKKAVNCNRVEYQSPKYAYTYNRIRLNHYVIKSKEEYLHFKPKADTDNSRINIAKFERSFCTLQEVDDQTIKTRYSKHLKDS